MFILPIFFMRHGTEFDDDSVPPGYQRQGKRVSIVDQSGKAVADGKVSEFAVTSESLPGGCWNDAEAIARRFVAASHGTRTFLTGDLGVRDASGLI